MALHQARGSDWGTNLARVKDFNQVVVLDVIRSTGPIGMPAIAAATGLTLQTVSNIVRRLLDADAVIEDPVPAGGRARRTLRLNPDAAYALGIQLVRKRLAVGVVDLAGVIRSRTETNFALEEAPQRVLERLSDLVADAVREAGIQRDQLLAAGIGAPGPLDLRSGVLLNLQSPASWSHFPMRQAVADALDMRVIMDNDATAAALGETWAGVGAGAQSFVYISLGTGLGAGLVIDGQAYRGVHGNAGELSHIQIEPDGPPCDCGRRGCLGLYLTADGLLREAARVALEAPPARPIAPAPKTVQELVDSHEPRYAAVIAAAAQRLARVVSEIARLLDPELIALGGPLVPMLGAPFGAALTRAMTELDDSGAPPPRIELSSMGSDAGVIGAATLVLHDVYAPTAHKLSVA